MTFLKPCLAVTVPGFGSVGGEALKRLRRSGFKIRLNTLPRALRDSETIAMCHDAVGVIAGVESWNASVLARCPRLKVISRIGVGLDQIDLSAARRKKVTILTTPGPVVEPVAEMTLGMILGLLRQFPIHKEAMAGHRWEPSPGKLLAGKTLGIVGLGRIGRRLTELIAPFGLKVLVFEKAPDQAFLRRHGLKRVALRKLLTDADIVTLHLPYTPATRHFMDHKRIGLMKRGAFLINTARGGLLDHDALIWALRTHRLGGAALDVFEKEPYQGILSRMPNVIVTPHVASFTEESWCAMEQEAVENLLRKLSR
ncbi:MAG: phosphoglycerate dehydrogenase [Candidatus Omnitrophica bacterium]|nr:phosphoglycerate dehydrogenase [Candidatus Omnitrophota bacterium]